MFDRNMAHDEMNTITVDKWDDEIWGVEQEAEDSESKTSPPKLFFYFAETVCFPSRQAYSSIALTNV